MRSTGTTTGTHTLLFNTLLVNAEQSVINGDIQYIQCGTTMITERARQRQRRFDSHRGMGRDQLRRQSHVNADNTGKPGVIDLIEVTGNMGTLAVGGPILTTGPGGNVRYFHVGGTAFRPVTAGGSEPEETTYAQGQNAVITDDSGANVVIEPTQELNFDPVTGGTTNNSGTLTVLTYPIIPAAGQASGGGSVILRVTSTRGMRITSTGLAEIGEVILKAPFRR
jgi:hypothetical protein